MARLTNCLLPFLLFVMAGSLTAQQSASGPARELRGVWLTTLLGLDWPNASLRGNVEGQKQALRDIFDDLQRQNFNAVFFQVRSRGNAMYRSSLEPWCSELTGTLGKDPGWDPLAFAIAEARARGLELHAWFNVYRIWSSGMPASSSPVHIAHAHPSWVKRYGEDLWLDPGIPEAREYTLRVMEELVRNYDIDGIHFDYCRYADRGFDDADTWRRHGGSGSRDDWRRNNISVLVENAYRRLSAIRPSLIIGSAPIGIYRNLPSAKGWEGRDAIYQDSRAWLKGGYHDYVVPQIYWGLTRNGSHIDFEALVRDWSDGSSGRHVYPGIAAYKDDIKSHLGEHIDAVREQGGEGIVFFRYEHIRRNAFAGRFSKKLLPPSLTWKNQVPPNPPRNLRRENGDRGVTLSWDAPAPAADGDVAHGYAVYVLRDDGARELLSLLPADRLSYQAEQSGATITVASVDRARNQSVFPEDLPTAAIAERRPLPHIPIERALMTEPIRIGANLVLLGYEVPRAMHVRLRLMNPEDAEVVVLFDGYASAGVHILGIELDRLDDVIESCVFEAGGWRVVLPFHDDKS